LLHLKNMGVTMVQSNLVKEAEQSLPAPRSAA
jgi:hypothetical protein